MRQFILLFVIILTFVINSVAYGMPNDQSISFLSVADIHFDPFVTCPTNSSDCPIVDKLLHAKADEWKQIFEAYDTEAPQYKFDTNYVLLQSTLAELKKTAEAEKISFVVILGDELGHHFKEHYEKYTGDSSEAGYQDFVSKTMQFLSAEIANTFPTIDVYSAVGNNDSYRGDNVTDPEGDFFKENAVRWGSLVKDPSNQAVIRQEFPEMGYYAVNLLPDAKVRLIVLNTAPFWQGIHDENLDQAVKAELQWLRKELTWAQENHQKVILTMHTPAGIDIYASLKSKPASLVEVWKPEYTQLFQAELQQFAAQIMVILPAHFHSDWFQGLQFGENFIPVVGTPSISPGIGNNPAFKVYRYSNQSLVLQDYTVYFNALSEMTWQKEYDFNEIYQPNCSDCRVIDGIGQFTRTGSLVANYKQYFDAGTYSSPIAKEEYWNYYWCQTQAMMVSDYQRCMG
jgi:hypothetical protein